VAGEKCERPKQVTGDIRVYCDHCQTTVVEGAKFCPFCGGKLTDAPPADAMDPSQAPTVALTIGPCESCGAPSLPGSTLCLPCTRAFESILGTQPQAPALPSAPVVSAAPDAATLLVAAVSHDDEPLADDEEYEDEPDEVTAEDAATVLVAAAPPAPPAPEPPAPAFSSDAMDWSTPASTANDHEGIVALPAWARKGPDTDPDPAAAAAAETPGAEPVPWWERNGQPSPTAAAKPDVARYVPPPAVAPPASASLESTLARQAMRPKSPAAAAVAMPAVTRPPSGNRSRTLVIGAALAGVAAIGTPVMWKLAFASRPTTVSALAVDPVAAPEPVAARPERVHGTPAAAPAAATPRVYQDLQPVAPEPLAPAAPVAVPAPASTHAAAKPTAAAPKKPAVTAAPEPVAAAPAAPDPAPLLVATPTPVIAAPAAAAPPPAQVQAEAVPLGQIFEVSQVETRPSVTSRFDPVLPARIGGATPVVVIARVLVSPSGRAVEATVVKNPSNDAGLGAAAVATVRQWGFAPAKKKGQPVSCWVNVGVVFKAASGD